MDCNVALTDIIGAMMEDGNHFYSTNMTTSIPVDGVFYLSKNCIMHIYDGFAIVADLFSLCFIGFYELDSSLILHSKPTPMASFGIIDLSADGDRWEGDVVDSTPCGWGELYDSDNSLTYRGFVYNNRKVCYGTTFHPATSSQIPSYSGGYFNNLPQGEGVLIDRMGESVYKGEFLQGRPLSEGELIIPRGTSEWSSLHSCIRELIVTDHSFRSLSSLSLQYMFSLEKLIIGSFSFMGNEVSSSFSLEHLPKLQEIELGFSSFSHTDAFSLSDLPSLRSLILHGTNFYHSQQCSIKDLCSLKTIEVGYESFFFVHWIEFRSKNLWLICLSDLPSLTSIRLHEGAFNGDSSSQNNSLYLESRKSSLFLMNRSSFFTVDSPR